jgi:hypothetical protein
LIYDEIRSDGDLHDYLSIDEMNDDGTIRAKIDEYVNMYCT